MPNSTNLFRLLNEFIVLLLGGLLVLLAATHSLGLPSHPGVLILLGFIFVFWAARAWTRPALSEGRLLTGVRAGSLAIVGILLIAIPLLALKHASLLIGVSGAVLLIRGLIGAGLSLRSATPATSYSADGKIEPGSGTRGSKHNTREE